MKHISNESSSTNADETNNNNSSRQLIQKEPIAETPFTAVRVDETWYLMLGKYRLEPEGFNSMEHVIEKAHDTSWHRIMQIIQIMIDENKHIEAEKQKA